MNTWCVLVVWRNGGGGYSKAKPHHSTTQQSAHSHISRACDAQRVLSLSGTPIMSHARHKEVRSGDGVELVRLACGFRAQKYSIPSAITAKQTPHHTQYYIVPFKSKTALSTQAHMKSEADGLHFTEPNTLSQTNTKCTKNIPLAYVHIHTYSCVWTCH